MQLNKEDTRYHQIDKTTTNLKRHFITEMLMKRKELKFNHNGENREKRGNRDMQVAEEKRQMEGLRGKNLRAVRAMECGEGSDLYIEN